VAVLILLLPLWARRGSSDAEEIARLRYANSLLQVRLEARRVEDASTSMSCSSNRSASHRGGSSAAQLLAASRVWDWRAIVTDFLRPWPNIAQQQLDTAVKACNGSSMYCQRFQIHNGRLYITDYAAIFFDRQYAPARVLPILETLRRHPHLPNLDIVVAAVDEPRIRAIPGDLYQWTRTCSRWRGGELHNLPPPLFSSTTNENTFDLPWLDFAWFFPRAPHKLRTAPWSVLHPQLVAAGGRVAWESKFELAMHTGNTGSHQRKLLVEVAKAHPSEILVNELFIGDHQKITKTCRQLGIHREGGFQAHKCYMTFEEQCSYKYLLNSASIGYANKFKSLLLCGSVVLYVRDGMQHKEFYEYGLLPGVHYVAVDTAADIPATVRWLREHDEYARAVGEAGRARMSSLDVIGLTDFMAELLTQYAKRLQFRVQPQPGSVLIECEDDLWRHYALSRQWLSGYLTRDNSTCVHPPPPNSKLAPPGWGGAYKGSKPRCYASHDLGPAAQPHACDFASPFSTAESWQPEGVFPSAHPASRDHWAEA